MAWVDVYADGLDLGSVQGDGATVYFSTGETRSCHAGYIRCARVQGVTCVLGQGSDTYTVPVVTSTGHETALPGPANGVQPCAINPAEHGFTAYYICHNATDIAVVSLGLDLTILSTVYQPMPPNIAGTSQGILYVELDGTVHYTDLERTRQVGGYTFGLPMVSGRWTIGQNYAGYQILAFNSLTGVVSQVTPNADNPLPPRIAMATDGQALAGLSSNPSQIVPSYAFVTPFTPIIVPVFVSTDQQIGVGIFDEPQGPNLIGGGDEADAETKGVLYTIGRDSLSVAAATAALLKIPLEAYWDSASAYPASAVPHVPGVTVRPLVQCYPLHDETTASFRTRIRSSIQGLVHAGYPVDLLPATYCQIQGNGTFNLGEQQVLDALQVTWETAIEFHAGALWCFTWDRGHGQDGLVRWPSLMEAVMRMRAASGNWRHFPTIPQPPTPFLVKARPLYA